MKTMIDTKRLRTLAQQHDWFFECIRILLEAAGIRSPKQDSELDCHFQRATREELNAIPEAVPYDALPGMRGKILLDIAESIHGVDPLKSSGPLFHAMALEFFVPQIPKDHPGYIETLRLLRVFKAYNDGAANAETYIRAAYNHRTTFCNVWGNKVEPDFEHLFEAMPNDGVETAIAMDGWALVSAWESFGRHLARSMPGFDLLEEIEDEIDGTIFVDDHDEHDREATESAHVMIDGYKEYLRDEALERYEERLCAMVEGFLRGEDGNGAA